MIVWVFRSCADRRANFGVMAILHGESGKTVCSTEKRFKSVKDGNTNGFFLRETRYWRISCCELCTLHCQRQEEEEDKWPEIESMKRERNFPAENEIVPRFFSMSGEEEEISLCLRSICCFCLFFSPE